MPNNAKQHEARVRRRGQAIDPSHENPTAEEELLGLIAKDEAVEAESSAIESDMLTPAEIEELREEMKEADEFYQKELGTLVRRIPDLGRGVT